MLPMQYVVKSYSRNSTFPYHRANSMAILSKEAVSSRIPEWFTCTYNRIYAVVVNENVSRICLVVFPVLWPGFCTKLEKIHTILHTTQEQTEQSELSIEPYLKSRISRTTNIDELLLIQWKKKIMKSESKKFPSHPTSTKHEYYLARKSHIMTALNLS